MNPINTEIKEFLNLSNHPVRFSQERAAAYLGFEPDHITILVNAGLLKPLGKPTANAQKYFAKVELDGLHRNREWLSKATEAINRYWQNRNAHRTYHPCLD
jgi:hypothetical protein